MVRYDVVVIGGGCVGCSVAKHLAEQSDLSICVLEKEHRFAAHQSGRNSGVLHPGFNYRPGSLKARFATEGTKRLKAYASANEIPLVEYGVVVVAQNAKDESRLHTLAEQANENGVPVSLIDETELLEHEPHVVGQKALFSPTAASIDSQQYLYALARDARDLGVDFYMGYEVETVSPTRTGHSIDTTNSCFSADYVVNAAGLYADRIAHEVGVGRGYQIVPFRGEYYELVPEKRHLCNSMIYPAPDPDLPFLGVHFTRRTDNKVLAGPNAVLAFGREAYRNTSFNLREMAEYFGYQGFWKLLASPRMLKTAWNELNKSYRKQRFVAAAQQLIPTVTPTDFVRSYAGIRAQLVSKEGELVRDPLFETGPRSLHVLNAVSPGLTSSLPVGDHLANRVIDHFE